jgi:hypothetical protein
VQIERLNKARHHGDVKPVAVVLPVEQLVRAPKPDEIRRYRAVTGRHNDRNHLSVEIAPRRFAMEQQNRFGGVAWALIQIVHPQTVEFDVVRRKGKVRQVGEAFVGGTQYGGSRHGAVPYGVECDRQDGIRPQPRPTMQKL